MSINTNVKVRFAPAPTGQLHLGNARTALFNWIFARQQDGEFILRIEDTNDSAGLLSDDGTRTLDKQNAVEHITRSLEWLGIDWDIGPVHQSSNRPQHDAAIHKLLEDGNAYYCDLTTKDIEHWCKQIGVPVGYYGWSRHRNVEDGPGVVVRYKCPNDNATTFQDMIRGDVHFPHDDRGDMIIRRSDGSPTFFLANAVDDFDMGITHVIRGEDLLNTTPKVLLLWEDLGYGEPPIYAHLPLVVNEQRQKLGKRSSAASLEYFRRQGYLPEAMCNYLALLGWGTAITEDARPIEEVIENFNLADIKPSPAIFDIARFDHINASFIKSLTPRELLSKVQTYWMETVGEDMSDAEMSTIERLSSDIQARSVTLFDVRSWIDWITGEPSNTNDNFWTRIVAKHPHIVTILDKVIQELSSADFSDADELKDKVLQVGVLLSEELGQNVKSQLPVRVALTGREVGLPLWEPMSILGKGKTLQRLKDTQEFIARVHPVTLTDIPAPINTTHSLALCENQTPEKLSATSKQKRSKLGDCNYPVGNNELCNNPKPPVGKKCAAGHLRN